MNHNLCSNNNYNLKKEKLLASKYYSMKNYISLLRISFASKKSLVIKTLLFDSFL